MEKTGDVSSSVESSLYNCVYAMLRELDTHTQAGSVCNKGMLRWTLHKKVENNPSTSISLLRVLIKELEKHPAVPPDGYKNPYAMAGQQNEAEKTDGKNRIIPLLHTLAYVVMQSAYIPDDLFSRMYVCLKRMVTLPEPYCTVGLNYARHLKIEHNLPGILYQRRVIGEHSLKNEHYPLHERVFVFVDAAVIPQSLLNAVRADVEFGASNWDILGLQRRVLLHTLQAGLGRQCHGQQLLQALENLGEDVEKYFQDIVAIVEERIADGDSDCDQYSTKLQQIYKAILSSASQDLMGACCLVGAPLPSPEISFHVWKKEDEIWNEMIKFSLMVNPSERNSEFLEDDDKHNSVISTVSTDSGIEGDLPLNEFPYLMLESPSGQEVQEQQKSASFFRRPCVRWPKAGNRMTLMMEAIKESGGTGRGRNSLPKEEKNFTARVVVMGDDRTVGRLGRAYHYVRQKEGRHLFLTKRVNLEIYYIPVTSKPAATSPDEENIPRAADMLTMAASLGRVDPWYDCNIKSLGSMILKLAEMHSVVEGSSEPNSFLLDIISYYTRTAQQPIPVPMYSVNISFSGLESKPAEEVFVCHLDMDFPVTKPCKPTFKDTIKGSVRYKRSSHENMGVVVAVTYRRASISNREVDVELSLTTSGVLISADPQYGLKNLHSLIVDFRGPYPTRLSTSSLRVTGICIRTLEEKTFTVRLDKDSDRIFKNVQSIAISPCTDPGYCLQKRKSGQVGEIDDSGLSKYLSKTFSLPINTFCGVAQ